MVAEYFIGKVWAWLAVQNTARPTFPHIEPAVAWELMGVGTNADPQNRLTDEGVTWEVPQTVTPERDHNDIFPGDAFRTEADQMVSFNLKDFRAEVIRKALNDAVQTNVDPSSAGESGYQQVSVSAMGVAVAKHALLVRVDNSPYQEAGGGYISEFWTPSCYEMSNFTTVLGSRAVSMVPFQFMSLLSGLAAHAADRMGSWRFQDTDVMT